MTAKVVLISGTVAVLGIISAVAGFVAEATRIKLSEVYIEGFSCVYPSSPAHTLGILALVCAILTRIVLLILVGCCCQPRASTSTPKYNFLIFISWVTSVVGLILFIAGVALHNQENGEQKRNGMLITCYVIKPGVFAAGAILTVFGTFFGIVGYLAISSATQTTSQPEFEPPVAYDIDVEL